MRFFLRCRKCGTTPTHSPGICGKCGPQVFRFSTNDPETESRYTSTSCTGCGEQNTLITKGLNAPEFPAACRDCGSHDLGWQSEETAIWWDPPLTPLAGYTGPWIEADFIGDYDSATIADQHEIVGGIRKFSLNIHAGDFLNARIVNAPPQSRGADEVPPLRQDFVDGTITPCPKDGVAIAYEGRVGDFRLHRWVHSSSENLQFGGVALAGRLSGTAFGRLPSIAELPVPPPPTPVREALPYSEALPSAQAPLEAARYIAPHCSRCSLLTLALTFLLLWLACDWKTAISGVVALLILCLLHMYMHRRRRESADGRLTHDIPLLGALIVFLGIVTFILGVREIAQSGCSMSTLWWLFALALLLWATAFHRSCWPRWIMTVIWIFALLAICKGGNLVCGQGLSGAPTQALALVVERVQNAFASLTSFDSSADIIDKAGERVPGALASSGRVSVDQALSNPARFFSCNDTPPGGSGARQAAYSIYFGDEVLFELNERVLTDNAAGSLRKLARLIQANPDVRIVLTGHTDQTGVPAVNLPLSEARAGAVAAWLSANHVLPSDQIEVRGVADRYPYVDVPGKNRLNRRVEVRLDCAIPRQVRRAEFN